MNKVVISEKAKSDLLQIWAFIAQENLAAADRLLDNIHEKANLLGEHPEAGRARPELALDLRSFAVSSYVMFYKESGSGIEVARVLHGARDILSTLIEE